MATHPWLTLETPSRQQNTESRTKTTEPRNLPNRTWKPPHRAQKPPNRAETHRTAHHYRRVVHRDYELSTTVAVCCPPTLSCLLSPECRITLEWGSLCHLVVEAPPARSSVSDCLRRGGEAHWQSKMSLCPDSKTEIDQFTDALQ